MIRKQELFTASTLCAALIGAGFASGREIESFFSRFGAGSHLGVLLACAGIGFLTYVILTLANTADADDFPDLFGRLMDSKCRDVMRLLHGLLLLMTSAAMISAGGELGALTFDMPLSRLLGAVIITLASCAAASFGLHRMGIIGLITIGASIILFAAFSCHPAEKAAFSFTGLGASLPMGLLYASFNTALTGGVIVSAAHEKVSPAKTGTAVAVLLACVMIPANQALLCVGERVRQSALPAVVLASRWGCAGYYIMIFVMALSVMTTLSAMLLSLRNQLIAMDLPAPLALPCAVIAAAVLSLCGFRLLVGAVYPLLGWICSFALVALLFWLPAKGKRS